MNSSTVEAVQFVKDLEGTQLAFDSKMKLYIPSLPSKAPDSFISGICSRWGTVTEIVSGKKAFGPDTLKSVTVSITWTDTHENRVSQLALCTKQAKIDYELFGKMQYFFIKRYTEPPAAAVVAVSATVSEQTPTPSTIQSPVSSMLPSTFSFAEKARGSAPAEKDGSRPRPNDNKQVMDYNALLQENTRLKSENARLTQENKKLAQDLEDREIEEKEQQLRAQLEELSARKLQRGGKK